MAGTKARQHHTGPSRLMVWVESQASSFSSSTPASEYTPALFTNTSTSMPR